MEQLQLQMQHEEETAALSQQLHSSGSKGVKVHVLPTVTTPKLFSCLPSTSNQKTKLASHFRFAEDADPVWKAHQLPLIPMRMYWITREFRWMKKGWSSSSI